MFRGDIFLSGKKRCFHCQCINLMGIFSSPFETGEREIKVLLERNISVIWQHMFQMSALPVQPIYICEGVKQNVSEQEKFFSADCGFFDHLTEVKSWYLALALVFGEF